jgi:hypothetical protein
MVQTRFRSYGADPVCLRRSYKDLAPTEPFLNLALPLQRDSMFENEVKQEQYGQDIGQCTDFLGFAGAELETDMG